MSSTSKLSLLSVAAALLISSSVFGETNQVVNQPKSPANPLPEPIAAGQAVAPSAAQNNPQRPVLGVRVKPAAEGVTVVGVTFGSPADRAGFHLGDEIRYVAEQRVPTAQDLTNEIQKLNPGSKVDMFVVRNGEPLVLTAIFPGNPPTSGQAAPQRAATQEQIRALNQQINQMNQQLYYQNQEINRMRSFRVIRIPPTDPVDYAWWLRVQRGETNNDPAIFQ